MIFDLCSIPMTISEIPKLRLFNQKISATEFKTAKEIVGWMCAMQAQDYAMAKWAVGTRLSKSTEKDIETALDKGEIIRTHLMRPTWHFVSADDIYWMLELTSPGIRSSMKSRHKELELSEETVSKSRGILEKSLAKRKNLTRDEIATEFGKAGIRTDGNRLSHLMLCAELDGTVCSGQIKNGKQTFALLDERVPVRKIFTREESLATMAKRYFTSHGPATLKDFTWWSGLPAGDARRALESVKRDFLSESPGPEQYWFPDSFSGITFPKNTVHLLPAFDEFLISYKDRSAALSLVDNKKAVSDNGIFRPVIVVNGKVTGLWKRTFSKEKVILELVFFRRTGKTTQSLLEKAAHEYGKFLGKEVEIRD
jgi:hypothetical protein